MNNLKRHLSTLLVTASLSMSSGISYAGGDGAKGQELAKVRDCVACHGADGNSTIGTNPKLAGQYESYLLRALTDYRSGARDNAIMAGAVADLTDQDLRDLAAWFADQDSDLYVVKD